MALPSESEGEVCLLGQDESDVDQEDQVSEAGSISSSPELRCFACKCSSKSQDSVSKKKKEEFTKDRRTGWGR